MCRAVQRSEAATSAARRARPWQEATLAPVLGMADLREREGRAAHQRLEGVAWSLGHEACELMELWPWWSCTGANPLSRSLAGPYAELRLPACGRRLSRTPPQQLLHPCPSPCRAPPVRRVASAIDRPEAPLPPSPSANGRLRRAAPTATRGIAGH
jgi:hypothetical protein